MKKTDKTQQENAATSSSLAATQGPAEATKTSKAAAVITLLKQDGGATLEQMMEATGWQKHSVRDFLAGALRKRHGLTVVSTKADGLRTYRAESAA